ncbi:uncharacterized protein A1O9_06996 [Exophiala aquamarina CBS 119918]|uniref:Uncharacterized protein n=1 Tax=Exophiala aquamarina CBS 119918 TaxID=1182545 RepID=A0A072PAE4_9EURO|nr:uncharacterized protein A1O9_06996 [Exophiala aquamarina CBS 119918]KEF56806.1 hypothetical protein A1O9_06996 [Exophiala aquamarina CBS 119918]
MLELPRSKIDVSGFLSSEARLRQPSSLKVGTTGLPPSIISLSAGRPSPDFYPFLGIDVTSINPQSAVPVDETLAQMGEPFCSDSIKISLPRKDPGAASDLSTALSYGYSLGQEQLVQFLMTHISHIHSLPYSDWEVCITAGNTSALGIAFRNLARSGGFLLVKQRLTRPPLKQQNR